MKFGISSACFYPENTENAVKFLADNKIPNIEIFFNSPSELQLDYLKELKDILGTTNVVSVHPFTSIYEPYLFFSEYERRFYDGLKIYESYFKAAQFLGAKYVILHGSLKQTNITNEEYFKRFEKIDSLAKNYGVRLLQENVAPFKSSSSEFISDMKQYIPDVQFVLDTKQCVRANEDILNMANVMGKNIAHVHISDHTENCDCLIPSFGEYDFSPLFSTLENLKYDGVVLIEVYKNNYTDKNELLTGYQKLISDFQKRGADK